MGAGLPTVAAATELASDGGCDTTIRPASPDGRVAAEPVPGAPVPAEQPADEALERDRERDSDTMMLVDSSESERCPDGMALVDGASCMRARQDCKHWLED